ncbi:MAG TPA: aminoglycoside adenylyltransferase domain-containing protein [Chloroflexota bacterium]|nr:aminoglycoside adenylyltransferase domain-containing protein [Chloroflexota bacterium]
MQRTSYPDVDRLIDLLLLRIQQSLGPKLVGLYLTGSLVTGDFDHDVSDIDMVAATSTSLDPDELAHLEAMHRAIALSEPKWDNRIEVVYISVDGLKTFRTWSSTIAVISPGEPFHTKEAGKDWLLNWYVVREKGRTLFGPSPDTLIDPISSEEAVRWVKEHVTAWRGWMEKVRTRNAQVYATLTLCRAFYSVTNRDFVSKRQAALWVESTMPEWRSLIENALRSWRDDWYNDRVDHQASLPETKRFVNAVIDRIVE